MKKHFFLKVISAFSVVLTAMAFSCQDHFVPEEPETAIFPANACTLNNGEPRPFPCEFEVVKIDFVYGPKDVIAGTATQADSVVHLTRAHPQTFITWGIHGGFYSFWRTRVTIRRIANPVGHNSKEYIFREAFRGFHDDNRDPYPITPPDNAFEKHTIDIPIGGTYTFASGFTMEGGRPTKPTLSQSPYILVQNVATSAILQKPPYSYTNYREIADAKMVAHMVVHL